MERQEELGLSAARPRTSRRPAGTFVEGPDVVNGNMVSCRGWGDLAEWSRAFVAALERAAVPA